MPKQNKLKIISAKDLGQLALLDFCPRCFWLERHLGKAPMVFPGIFSTLDAITKRSAHYSFARQNRPPKWLDLPEAVGVVEESTFFKLPVEYNWILTGQPDDIFQLEDKSYQIVDYKTAKFTGRQDELLPMYEIQLNAYAYLAEKYDFTPVSGLSLVYFQPREDLEEGENFKLSFDTYQLKIKLDIMRVPKLLAKAREIVEQSEAPESRAGCTGICQWLEKAFHKSLKH